MSEQSSPPNPELEAALKAYHIEIRDGTEQSQKTAFERLVALKRRLGLHAVEAAQELGKDEENPPQLLAS